MQSTKLLGYLLALLLMAAPACNCAGDETRTVTPAVHPEPPVVDEPVTEGVTRATEREEQYTAPAEEEQPVPEVPAAAPEPESGASAYFVDANLAARIRQLERGAETNRLVRYEKILKLYPDLDYAKVGSVLEGLVRAEMLAEYPPDTFRITGGIQYFSEDDDLLGELDLVVMAMSGSAVMVGEMKLSTATSSALSRNRRHARRQLQRFRDAIADGSVAYFEPGRVDEIRLTPAAFASCGNYVLFGPRGSMERGYDRELDIDREEGEELMRRLTGGN